MSFHVWAPAARDVTLVINGRNASMTAERGGYFSVTVEGRAGDRYGFKLDQSEAVLPDPASRSQPDGPHGLSQVVDPSAFHWQHDRWNAAPIERQILYEMHVGTFTSEGTWRAAATRLPDLKEIGITLVELMPICEFAGAFGWGYDGVQWFAPYHGYGTPDDFRAFVDAAHGLGIGVILDVVYNHFGPDGNYLPQFAPVFFATEHRNEWGEAINYDGAGSEEVRTFAIANIRYWVDEFRIDGFRFDAVQQLFDDSPEHIAAALTREARAAAGKRPLFFFAEHEPQHAHLARDRDQGGYGLDGIWNEDFHHAAVVALTGTRIAYYSEFAGSARELVSCARHGFLFQGQHYRWQRNLRGAPALDLPVIRTVCCLENHDQIANSPRGDRLHRRAAPGCLRALTTLLLLGPWVPLLFQGQEFHSSKPFFYFADHHEGLRDEVAKGRRHFLTQFRNTLDPDVAFEPPHDRKTFERCVLDDEERRRHHEATSLHRDLIALRVSDITLSSLKKSLDGSALDDRRLVLRFQSPDGPDRLLAVNLGGTFDLSSVSEPLVAPPASGPWSVIWHSERPEYGGGGMAPLERLRWDIPGASAVLLGASA